MIADMAASMPQMPGRGERAMKPPATASEESEGPFFSLIRRYRVAVLTSPLWLAVIFIFLNVFGGLRVREVIHFLTGSPLK